MRKKYLINLMVGMMLIGVTGMAKAITWGERDEVSAYPNVVSVRGIKINNAGNYEALGSCSGSLLQSDNDKIVILTAAHCTDRWIEEGVNSVGVSFDLDNVIIDNPNTEINESFTDVTNYEPGGVPISIPEKHSPFEKFDYGFVVFSGENKRAIVERWSGTPGALTPVQLPPNETYLHNLIKSVANPTNTLSFTAVGYGSGEITGSAKLSNINFDPFLIRHTANNLSYNAHNPVNDILRLSQNIAKGENGTCKGDSGGPIFFKEDNSAPIQVSLTSGGDAACRATNTGPGFSRPEAIAFIRCGMDAGDVSVVKNCVDQLGN